MIDKRLITALIPLALLSACQDEVAEGDSRSARGEVLEGTISDAMLPLDRVRSEPPLEDPDAFAEAQEEAAERAGGAPGQAGEAAVESDEPAGDEGETAAVPPPEPAD